MSSVVDNLLDVDVVSLCEFVVEGLFHCEKVVDILRECDPTLVGLHPACLDLAAREESSGALAPASFLQESTTLAGLKAQFLDDGELSGGSP